MNNITITWGGTLAVLLAKLKKIPYRVTRIKHDVEAQIKRIGIYYMCIDDMINQAFKSSRSPGSFVYYLARYSANSNPACKGAVSINCY